MRCVAFHHNTFTYMHGRIVMERSATHEKTHPYEAGIRVAFSDEELHLQRDADVNCLLKVNAARRLSGASGRCDGASNFGLQ